MHQAIRNFPLKTDHNPGYDRLQAIRKKTANHQPGLTSEALAARSRGNAFPRWAPQPQHCQHDNDDTTGA